MIDKELHIKIVGIYSIFALICGLGVWTTLPIGLSLLVTLLVLLMCGGVHGFIVLKEFYKTGSEIIVEARDTQNFVQTEVNSIQQKIENFSSAINDLNSNQFLLEDRLSECVRKIENFPIASPDMPKQIPHQSFGGTSEQNDGTPPEDLAPDALDKMNFLSSDEMENKEVSAQDKALWEQELEDFADNLSDTPEVSRTDEVNQIPQDANFEDSLLDAEFEDVTQMLQRIQAPQSEFAQHALSQAPVTQEVSRLKNIPIEGMESNSLFDEDFEDVSTHKFSEHDKKVINEWGRLSHSFEAPLESLDNLDLSLEENKDEVSDFPEEEKDFDFLSEDFLNDESLDESLEQMEVPPVRNEADPLLMQEEFDIDNLHAQEFAHEERELEAVGMSSMGVGQGTVRTAPTATGQLEGKTQQTLPSLQELVPELSVKSYSKKSAHIHSSMVPSLANIIAQNDAKEPVANKPSVKNSDVLEAFEALKQQVNESTHARPKQTGVQKEDIKTQASKPIIVSYEPLENLLPTVRYALEANQINACVLPIVGSQDKKTYYYQVLPYLYHQDEKYYPMMPIMSDLKQTGLETAIDKLIMTRCISLARNLSKASSEIGLFMQVHVKSLTDGEFFDEFYEMLLEKQQAITKVIIAFSQNQLAYMTSVRLEKMINLSSLGISFALTDVRSPLSDLQELKTIGFSYLKLSLDQIASGIYVGGVLCQGMQIKQLCEEIDVKLIVDELQNSYDILSASQSGADFITSSILSDLERVG